MMNKYSFKLSWSDEDEAYVATCPEFPGLSAFGETAAEALKEAKVALELLIEAYQESGKPLPEPKAVREYSGQFRVRIPKTLHQQLVEQAEDEGVSLNALVTCHLAHGAGQSAAVSRYVSSGWRVFNPQRFVVARPDLIFGNVVRPHFVKEPDFYFETAPILFDSFIVSKTEEKKEVPAELGAIG
jgi:predicted RNase H-like HicB family nuclease